MSWYPVDKTEKCLMVNRAGLTYESLPCIYENTIGLTFTGWEKNYDPINMRDKMTDNPWVPIVAIAMYGIMIGVGRTYFKTREPWSWRTSLAFWNLGLSVFSLIGFCRVAPQLAHNLYHYTISENFCFDPEQMYGSDHMVGTWVQFFVLSKFPELIDTYFIVIHKKPLILLHWYHHISVLAYCWHSYVTKAPPGIIFCVMNYAVHAIMYFYYFLMAVKCKPKWFNSMYITVSQISQMVVGVIVTILGFVLPPFYEGECRIKKENNIAALIMYGSYLLLFLQFFFKRYSSVPKKQDAKKNS
mmetsp:Transcript_3190/g.8830  ORF Transcript_3190/g.8830 Transcript_3190/m.8830 type:complete len:300 (-) Transcript_3190:253-1152(-)|eukprot:CAMPEP_0172366394 /NCGR_PEP_ID=MMETSP1060-20121228/14808_1 /TAXON_ID=37318 /ORGANISM="Pseudo-nitzschia pungens, Strain cf. cingulata" /LENGTH=299 /DNA_ID=CAMNT_0013090223 /DNA_START=125 /DNA_END=1024 /DNA_ORIENTATION=+